MKKIAWIVGIFLLGACSTNQTLEATPAPNPTLIPYAPTIFEVPNEAQASQARLDDPRPNIIFILTDDQPYHTVEYMPTVREVLMKEGVNFENGYVTTPLCCPSRVSILSGQYVHNHEVYTNRMPMGGAPKFDDSTSFALWLQDRGYHTAYFGKYLNEYEGLVPYGYVPPGWDEWMAFLGRNLTLEEDAGNAQYYSDYSVSENGNVVEYSGENSVFSADLLTRRAVDYISEHHDAPFFLFVSYYNPHSPYFWAERHDDQFRARGELQAEIYRPPNFMEEDVSDKPQYLQDLNPISVEKIDISYKQILRSLLSVDDGVASILAALEKTGLSDNTVIFFLSDNGLTVGNHRLGLTKNCAYEECARVPFIVYAPAMFGARTDSHLVANIDLAPTFADLAGASVPQSVDGTSLLPLLRDENAAWRDAILLEHWPTEDGIGSRIPEFYAVRTAEWKYVEYSTGESELYDLRNDPYELNNLTNSPQYADVKAELKVKLDELKKQ